MVVERQFHEERRIFGKLEHVHRYDDAGERDSYMYVNQVCLFSSVYIYM